MVNHALKERVDGEKLQLLPGPLGAVPPYLFSSSTPMGLRVVFEPRSLIGLWAGSSFPLVPQCPGGLGWPCRGGLIFDTRSAPELFIDDRLQRPPCLHRPLVPLGLSFGPEPFHLESTTSLYRLAAAGPCLPSKGAPGLLGRQVPARSVENLGIPPSHPRSRLVGGGFELQL